jgi:glutamine amidotransferase
MLENWVNVPTNSILTIHRQTVMVHPILDKYYERDPHHVRSSAFVQAKGLISNEKAPSGSQSPGNDAHQAGLNGFRKMMAHSVASRSLSPDLTRRSITPVSMKESYFGGSQPPGHSSILTPSKPIPAQGNMRV